MYEIGCQTEYKIERPMTPHKMPRIQGVSKKTLIEDNELFIYEDEVEPILSVLCGKTLELARMEVLQEEEIAEMQRQQTNYKNIRTEENNEIRRMEELEQKKLDAYEAKKSLEKSRREAKKVAHQKGVSRSVAKQFNSGLKFNTLVLLKDIGYFSDPFKEEVLDAQVLPWLFEQTEKFVNEGAAFNSYPNTIVASHIEDKAAHHVKKVEEHRKLLADRRQAAEDAAAQKLADKLARRAERERLRKEAERKELENKIEKAFIEPHSSVTEVAATNIIEIDGWNHT